MLRQFGLACLIFGLAAGLPTESQGQKKKKKDKEPDSTQAVQEDYDKLKNTKELTGKLLSPGTGSLSFRLEVKSTKPNPKYKPPAPGKSGNAAYDKLVQDWYRLQRDQQALAFVKNPAQYQQKLRQIQLDMQRIQTAMAALQNPKQPKNSGNDAFIQVTENRDYEFELVDLNPVVRRKDPPVEYDDKGSLKVYSKEDLEKMRGKDKTKPGLEAKFEDLAPGQTIKIYLKPPEKKKAPAKKDKEKDKDDPKNKEDKADVKDKEAKKEVNDDPEAPPRPRVTMIMILEDVAAPLPDPPKKKKKN
jgi:hypothetical protein